MDGDQAVAVREVPENTPAGMTIGDPVVAEDKDGDVLTYTLEGTDAQSFTIDWATGQLMTKGRLDADTSTSGKTDYEVVVRATDPAGIPEADPAVAANSDVVTVMITVTDVNEPPVVEGEAEVTFEEVMGDIATSMDTYTATDPEMDNPITWSVTGADAERDGKFSITGGNLAFKAKPDYEAQGDANGDNVYEVTVVATDSNGNRKTKDVEVKVMNEDEGGTVTLSRTQPRVGVPVTASLTDPDGSISGLRWQWYSDNVVEGSLDENAIEDATSDTYTPTAAEVTMDDNIAMPLAMSSCERGQATPTVQGEA